MRVAHFDCFSGISGDMTLAALIDSGVDPEAIRTVIASFKLPIEVEIEKVKRNGIAATYVNIKAEDQESHRYLPDVIAIIESSCMTPSQKQLALKIFQRLADAEATVHGMAIEKVHFHEVGALDSIADICGAAVGLDLLGVEKFTSRSVPPGSGTVLCDHGIMPIPAPATAQLLKGVPLASAKVTGELVTPTGAAILTTVVSEYTEQPEMTIERIGIGAGKRNPIEQPNVLRLFIGESKGHSNKAGEDTVWLLETNLDDVPGEIVGYTCERLLEAGALDVFTIPIQMKKFRPGVILSVLCAIGDREKLERVIFRETRTLGIRRIQYDRTIVERELRTIQTPEGDLRLKHATHADISYFKVEYEGAARLARATGVPLREIVERAREQSK